MSVSTSLQPAPSPTASESLLPSPSASPSPSPSSSPLPIYNVSDPSIKGVLLWLGITTIVAILCMIAYEVIRVRQFMKRVLYTRRLTTKDQTPPIPKGWLSWVKVAVTTDESFFLENIGLDAVMFLRFMRTSFLMFGLLAVLFTPSLTPLNNYLSVIGDTITMVNTTDHTVLFQDQQMDSFSVAGIQQGSQAFWVHVLCAYTVTASMLAFLYKDYKFYANMATAYFKEYDGVLARRAPSWRRGELIQLRTVMVQGIPHRIRDDEQLKDWFNSLGIGDVQRVTIDRRSSKSVEKLMSKRNRTLAKLEKAYEMWYRRIVKERDALVGPKRPWYKPGWLVYFLKKSNDLDRENTLPLEISEGLTDEKIQGLRPTLTRTQTRRTDQEDMIAFYSKKLVLLTHRIKQQRLIARNPDWYISENDVFYNSTGFVTFKSQRAAQMAAQLLTYTTPDPSEMRVLLAPSPHDIIWGSVSMPLWRRYMQRIVVGAGVFFFCLFWTIPAAAVSSLVNLDNLAKIPYFKNIITNLVADNPTLTFLINSLGPPMVLGLLNLLVPYIMIYISYLEARYAHTDVEVATLTKYFFFLFLNVFFVFALSGAFFGIVVEFWQNPMTIITSLLATKLPGASTFFINYIQYSINFFSLELIRPGATIYDLITYRFFSFTPRDFHEGSLTTSYLNYGALYPFPLLVFVIISCYAVIAPLVLLPGTLFFLIGWVVYRNQLLFVYVKEWEGYGRHWCKVFTYCIVGIVIGQLTLCGVLMAKNVLIPAIVVFALVPITVAFHRYCEIAFKQRTVKRFIPLDQLFEGPDLTAQSLAGSADALAPKPSGTSDRHPNATQSEIAADRTETAGQQRSDERSGVLQVHTTQPAAPPSLTISPAAPTPLVPTPMTPAALDSLGADSPIETEFVTSPEHHNLERYMTKYVNPAFSKPLQKPWVNPAIAEFWNTMPKGVSNSDLAELCDKKFVPLEAHIPVVTISAAGNLDNVPMDSNSRLLDDGAKDADIDAQGYNESDSSPGSSGAASVRDGDGPESERQQL
ncbi:uncharacterized protein BJ171DRAFT_489378 [Polychytrium aggregatum]|uniref:uncharacterized protein n=1 Tax=Polychytrium aggregatum TaxID=110093 RepID=UPI0022FEA911|nr:uncharacterized protein BJ171DRAFT_489378 [Polychytrium aggregatum]KAI9208568.1 hypothetical protein BJ171DRAFT_489378 [Polychytrium aggregatum]